MKTSTKIIRNTKLRMTLIGICAILAGAVNGFFGTGGGIVLVFALSLLPEDDRVTARDKFATVIAVILPLSLASAFTYGRAISLELASPYIVPGIIGGVIGALLLDRINVNFLKKLFAAMVLWAGTNFLS